VAIDNRQGVAQNAYQAASHELSELPEYRKNLKFDVPFCLGCGLQGAWQSADVINYAVVRLPAAAKLAATRSKNSDGQWSYGWSPHKWVNGSAAQLALIFAEHGIQTLVFTPASKHYPFSVANDIELSEQAINCLSERPAIYAPAKVLAEYEFGAQSEVFELIERGLSVHTALMIETEKIASEATFRDRATRIMLATGTLAQGLNLPATAVIIAGTRIGDPRGEDVEVVERRKLSQLLNAAGRAGRAGFANQGVVIAIPDEQVFVSDLSDIATLRAQLNYLQRSDDAVQIASGLDGFLDQIAAATLSTDSASLAELQAIAILSGADAEQPAPRDVLNKSYAMFRRTVRGEPNVSDSGAQHLATLREHFVTQNGAPQWLPLAAQRAGLDFLLMFRLAQAWGRVYPQLPPEAIGWSVWQWTETLVKLVAHVPPLVLFRQMDLKAATRGNEAIGRLFHSGQSVYSSTDASWTVPAQWVDAWTEVLGLLRPWMEGKTIVEIAALLMETPVEEIAISRNAGSQPIPKTLALINGLWGELAIIAGGIVAIAEQLFLQFAANGAGQFSSGVPLNLACLPMCIKYGFLTAQSLAWFRFGLRLRRPAHLLAQAFPPPDNLGDQQLRDWVRRVRSEWLTQQSVPPEDLFAAQPTVFNASQEFLTVGSV
jgi:hypothetical protein